MEASGIPGVKVKHNKDRLLTGRTVVGYPFESICSLRAILRALRERLHHTCDNSHERKCLTKGIKRKATV